MDRGIPTEEVLAQMRAAEPPVSYLVGTPKGRLSKLEKALLDKPWQAVREGVDVKLLTQDRRPTSLPKAVPASRRNGPCVDASSNGCGHGSSRSPR